MNEPCTELVRIDPLRLLMKRCGQMVTDAVIFASKNITLEPVAVPQFQLKGHLLKAHSLEYFREGMFCFTPVAQPYVVIGKRKHGLSPHCSLRPCTV